MIKHISLYGFIGSYAFLLLIIILSYREKLNIAKDVIITFLRMSVQLFLSGFVLLYIFKLDSAAVTTIIFLIMIFFASRIVISRTKVNIKNAGVYIFLSILISAIFILSILLFGIIKLDSFNPRYVIPLAGMVIGNSMNSMAIGIERFNSQINENRDYIEDMLCMGADRNEALFDMKRAALKSSLLPSLSSASGMGIVFLPGMMTGQILSGINPVESVYYQIVIVMAIAVSVALSNYLMLNLIKHSFFNRYDQPTF